MNNKELLFDSFQLDYKLIGKLRLRVYNDLLGAEAGEMENFSRQQSQALLHTVSLAKRVSEAREITFDEAYEMLTSGRQEDAVALMDVADDAALWLGTAPNVSSMDDQVITLIMQSRAEIENQNGWEPFDDWTLEDTRRLPSRFRAEVRAFIEQERNGGQPPERRVKKAPRSAAKPSEE
jgi:hypothetical protein